MSNFHYSFPDSEAGRALQEWYESYGDESIDNKKLYETVSKLIAKPLLKVKKPEKKKEVRLPRGDYLKQIDKRILNELEKQAKKSGGMVVKYGKRGLKEVDISGVYDLEKVTDEMSKALANSWTFEFKDGVQLFVKDKNVFEVSAVKTKEEPKALDPMKEPEKK